jgi:phage gp29-like protein
MANDLVPFQAPGAPALVDLRGQPMRAAVQTLTSEIGGPTMSGVRNIWSGHPAQGLNPAKLACLLRDAEQGDATAYLELAEEIEEKYPHYNGVLGVRKRAVAQLPIRVEAAGETDEEQGDAALVRDWTKRLTLQAELIEILDALGKAYSATEIIWETGELWLPAQIKRRDPRFFEYDQATGEQLLLKGGEDGNSSVASALPPYKFIVHQTAAKSGLPIRGGLARVVAWYYLFANFALKDWMTFLEVYGLPLRVGKYQNGTSEDDIRLLAQAVGQIGSDAGAVIPQSMMIEFVQSGGAAANPDMFRAMLTYIDDAVSKVVLGQTSSSDAKAGGLGSGQANLHGDVREDIADADAVELSATLTRDLAMPMVLLNRGRRKRYPQIIVGRPDAVDVKEFLDAADRGVKMGVPIAISTWRERTGIPEPKAGEPVLMASAAPAAQDPQGGGDGPDAAGKASTGLLDPFKRPSEGVGGRDVAAAAQARKPDAIDTMVEEALTDWQGMVDPLLGSFDDLIAGATSMEEVRELLAMKAGDVIAAMDVTAIVQLGERVGFAGKIAGLVEKPGR